MQPPPRKVKHSVGVKNIQAEHLTKLQQKHQQDAELLEDIRLYSKQRSVIEKEYAQSLCKLAQQFMNKRNFQTPPNLPPDDESRTVNQVWKTVLEETDRVGKARITAAETYLQQISESAKPVKATKTHAAKKIFDQINTLHKEVSLCVQELVNSQKAYSQDEHLAHESRLKASEAEDKVKNKSTGLFTSLATLQKNSAKLNSRRETCEVKSTSSRNDYHLNLSSCNAHQTRYYTADLPDLIKTLDGDMYERVKDFFMVLCHTELESCGLTQECFTKIMADSTMISRQYNLQCFLHENQVFNNIVQYKFEPQDNDQVTKVSHEHNASSQLEKEARKAATRIAKESKTIRDTTRQLQILQQQQQQQPPQHTATSDRKSSKPASTSSQEGGPNSPVDPELRMDELRQTIRRSETGKLKAEAQIDLLRAGGVNVDVWLKSAQAEALAVEEEEASQRSPSTQSLKTEATAAKSKPDVTPEESEPAAQVNNAHSTSSAPNDSTYINYEEDDYVDETFDNPAAAAAAAAAAGAAVTSSGGPPVPDHTSTVGPHSGRVYPCTCVALYDFEGDNNEELTLKEAEPLTLIADGDGDGWVKAENQKGVIGFIPENYVQMLGQANGVSVDHNEVNVDTDAEVDVPTTVVESPPQSAGYQSADPPASGDPGALTTVGSDQQDGNWVRALYDYGATTAEELTFSEGQLIRLRRKAEDGVDDGWWEGELNGKVGVFPSLVVEEIESAANAAQELTSPMRPGPPPFTPPDLGPPPPQLEITQPTPTEDGQQSFDGGDDVNEEKTPAAEGEDFPLPPPDVTVVVTDDGEQDDKPEETKSAEDDVEGNREDVAPPPAVEDEAPPVLPDEDHAMDAPASEDPEPPPPPPAESATSPECDIVVMAEVHAGPEAQAAGQTATDKATEQTPDQATEPVTDLANEQLADLAIAQPAEKATEQPADQATDLPTDVPTDLLIDIPVSCDQQPSITPAQADVTDTDAVNCGMMNSPDSCKVENGIRPVSLELTNSEDTKEDEVTGESFI